MSFHTRPSIEGPQPQKERRLGMIFGYVRSKAPTQREMACNLLASDTPITVPEKGIGALNKTGRKWVKSDDGTGYTALIEVFHQLHCLVSTVITVQGGLY